MNDDVIMEELKKLGVPLNEEEELRNLKDVSTNEEDLEKELEKLLNQQDDINAEGEMELKDDSVDELDKMLSQVSLEAIQAPDLPSMIPTINQSVSPQMQQQQKQQALVNNYEKVMQEQIKKCEQAFEYYKSRASKEKAILFGRRQKALEDDLKNISSLKQFTKCQVQYEVAASINESLKDDQLEVTCEGLELGQRLGIVLEFYTDVQAKQILGNGKSCVLKVKRTDLRTAKFFEHRRIRIHLMEEYSYWFIFTAFKTIDKQSFKLDALLTTNEVKSKVEFKNGRQKVEITLRLRRPINSSANAIKVRETWQVATNGNSRGLYPDLPVQELYLLSVDQVKSYNGLEYEILLMQKLKDTPQYDADRLLLLETQRDIMSLQVQLGRITPEDYKASLEAEKNALKVKAVREKSKPAARAYLKHMKLIEEELKEMLTEE